MKKLFIFAMAFVASVLAFTSCDPNNPDNPQEVSSIKELVGTKWRVDSAYVGDNVPTHMYEVFEITSENSFKLLGESDTYSLEVKDHKVTLADYPIDAQTLNVVKATKEWIHLSAIVPIDENWDGTPDKEGPFNLYISRIPESNGEKVPLTAENIVGTWKGDYYEESGVYTSGESWYRVLPSLSFHGLDYITFKADGTLEYVNLMDQALGVSEPMGGRWAIVDGKFAYSTGDADGQGFEVWQYGTPDELTTNVFILRRVWPEYIQVFIDHFHKVK